MVRLEGAGVHVNPAAVVEDGTAHTLLILVLRTVDTRCEV
jgi:hypothetical protein